MHRSSENVAAIATALAKAQMELSNPEKAMIGTIYNNRSDTPQSFRYASLSSGLDIIRKTLGGQQIAVAQTTHIDRTNGMVNLTTVLLHTSGEWIASDWPVCRLSETSAPRRMGAALTYARRYALFTMVGIAGEDDLDAPDSASDQYQPNKAGEALDLNADPQPAPARSSRPRTTNPATPPVREKLNSDDSATVRTQLIQEIQTLSEGDLPARAIGILKAKNRLLADDAKQVEAAFAARMVLPGSSQDDPASAPTEPALAAAIKRPRGRPRQTKPAAEPAAPLSVAAKPVIDESPPESIPLQTDTTLGKIDKSVLTISEPRRLRDKAHLKFVGSQPCLICARSPADAHHLKFTQPRAMGRKVSDEFTVPLCRTHHRDIHSFGDEVAWWARYAIDPVVTARTLWISTRRIE